MNGESSPGFRFLVRRGYKGWMVYDRQRKGPALVGTNPAVDLTEERANDLKRLLSREDAHGSPREEHQRKQRGTGPQSTLGR